MRTSGWEDSSRWMSVLPHRLPVPSTSMGVGNVVVPAFDHRHVAAGSLAAGVAAILTISFGKILGLFGRRLGAGVMQFRLQARYRRRVIRRYLELPLAWHQKHATGTLLSNVNADVDAMWNPIAPLPFAVGPG